MIWTWPKIFKHSCRPKLCDFIEDNCPAISSANSESTMNPSGVLQLKLWMYPVSLVEVDELGEL